ncbi:hypothetical protein DFH09DRAFT_1113610 [Mycena vulgaris]|nr:hypothetical protein DFH09DRAFT_1113610 [Mycena vulgaris]
MGQTEHSSFTVTWGYNPATRVAGKITEEDHPIRWVIQRLKKGIISSRKVRMMEQADERCSAGSKVIRRWDLNSTGEIFGTERGKLGIDDMSWGCMDADKALDPWEQARGELSHSVVVWGTCPEKDMNWLLNNLGRRKREWSSNTEVESNGTRTGTKENPQSGLRENIDVPAWEYVLPTKIMLSAWLVLDNMTRWTTHRYINAEYTGSTQGLGLQFTNEGQLNSESALVSVSVGRLAPDKVWWPVGQVNSRHNMMPVKLALEKARLPNDISLAEHRGMERDEYNHTVTDRVEWQRKTT